MKHKQTIIIAVGILGVACIVYVQFFRVAPAETPKAPAPDGVATETAGILPTDAVLYFTAKGCTSLPYVSALDENNTERIAGERFSATDGYDYSPIEGTRENRTILSRFTGACEDITPTQTDTFQALEVGVTQAEEGNAE